MVIIKPGPVDTPMMAGRKLPARLVADPGLVVVAADLEIGSAGRSKEPMQASRSAVVRAVGP